MRKLVLLLPIGFLAYLLFLVVMNDTPMDKFQRSIVFVHYMNTSIWTIILTSSVQFYMKYKRHKQKGGASLIYFILAIASVTLLMNELYLLLYSLNSSYQVLDNGGFFGLPGPWIASKLAVTVGGLSIIYLYIQGRIDKIAFQSSTDELTNIPNRRTLEDLFRSELSRSKRHKFPMSCAMIDIDFFKKFNDTYGHQTGDYVLQQVALIMDNGKRAHDVVARYGGEEFIWLLISSEYDDSYLACERLRKEIDATEFEFNEKPLSITVSIGVSSFHGDGEATVNSLIYNADKSLYEAKNAGRNKTISFKESDSAIESD